MKLTAEHVERLDNMLDELTFIIERAGTLPKGRDMNKFIEALNEASTWGQAVKERAKRQLG